MAYSQLSVAKYTTKPNKTEIYILKDIDSQ